MMNVCMYNTMYVTLHIRCAQTKNLKKSILIIAQINL